MGNWIAIVVIMVMLWTSIAGLRRDHSDEIYAIWYAFSLFFLIFLTLHLLAERSDVDVTLALGPQFEGALRSAYRYFTDIDDEIVLVGTFVMLSVGPQLLAYVLSSFSGSARPPQFVRTVSRIAVLSLVKFLAVWGSIILSDVLARFLLGNPVNFIILIQGFALVAVAFALADAEHKYLDQEFSIRVFPGCSAILDVPLIKRLCLRGHRFSTRHASRAASEQHGVLIPEWEWKLGGRVGSITFRGPVPRLIHSVGARWFPGHVIYNREISCGERAHESSTRSSPSDNR